MLNLLLQPSLSHWRYMASRAPPWYWMLIAQEYGLRWMTLRAIHTEERLLTRAELAESILNCDEQTVRRMERAGMPVIRWGKRYLRYQPSRVLAWLEEQGG